MSDSEWQGKVQQMKTNVSKLNKVILSFKMKQKASLVPEEFYSIFCALYNYSAFSNIDNREIHDIYFPYKISFLYHTIISFRH